eukprot:g464.t1
MGHPAATLRARRGTRPGTRPGVGGTGTGTGTGTETEDTEVHDDLIDDLIDDHRNIDDNEMLWLIADDGGWRLPAPQVEMEIVALFFP